MDNLIKQLEMLTLEVIHNLAEMSYEEINAFVDKREQLVLEIQRHPLTEADKLRHQGVIHKLLDYDSTILGRMQELLEEADAGLGKMQLARRQNQAYATAYAPDSYFFDRKK
jgi:hypothetical protein